MLQSRAARVVLALAMATTMVIGGAVLPAAGADAVPPGGGSVLPDGDPGTSDPARAEAFAEVEAAAGAATVRALVALDAPTGLDAGPAIDSAAAVVEAALDDVEGEVVRRYATLPYVSVEVSAEGVDRLSEVPEAVTISELDMIARPQLSNSLPAIEAPDAWNLGAEGADQLVAVIDSGLDTSNASPHPALASRVAYEACFTHYNQCPGPAVSATGAEASAPCDDHITCGHGTAVTAIAAAVAPQAEVLSIRAGTRTYCSGWTCLVIPNGVAFFPDDILAALDHVATFADENPTAPPIAAVNMSLGALISAEQLDDPDACDHHDEEPLLAATKRAVDGLTAQGIAVVVASGNDGEDDQVAWPACVTGAIAVGATDVHNQEVVSYSNSSPKVDLLAPGGDGTGCASPDGLVVPWDDGTLTSCSGAGTSFAAPHVAGAWAVLRELTDAAEVPGAAAVPVIRHLLTTTGVPITDARNSLTRPALLLGTAVEAVDSLPDTGELEALGTYHPVAATTIVDTRIGLGTCDGVPCDRLASARVQAEVAGAGPIPASGVEAVLVRVTARDPLGVGVVFVNVGSDTTDGAVLVSPGQDDAVTVLAHLEDGTIGLTPFFVDTDVQVDVLGYFGDDPLVTGLGYQPVVPSLVADTAEGTGDCVPSPCARLAAEDPVVMEVGLAPEVGAAMLNVSVTAASGPGTVQVTDSGGVVATFEVDDGRDVADLVPVDGDVTVEATVAVDVSVVRVGEFGEEGGRLVRGYPAIMLDSNGIGLCDPGPCGPLEGGVPTRVKLPGLAGVPDECISAVALVVVGTSQDPGVLAIGPDGDGSQGTLRLPSSETRGQMVLATPDEEGFISLDADTDMDVGILATGWLACPTAQWVDLFT